jgi:hypothetical protein
MDFVLIALPPCPLNLLPVGLSPCEHRVKPNLFFKMLEKSKQKFGGYVSILYVHAKFREKLSFFVSYVKTPDIQIIGFP